MPLSRLSDTVAEFAFSTKHMFDVDLSGHANDLRSAKNCAMGGMDGQV
jgi:hypothetical protein